jgi:hypothetical protein
MTPTQQCSDSGGPAAGDSGEDEPDVQRTSMGQGAGTRALRGRRTAGGVGSCTRRCA